MEETVGTKSIADFFALERSRLVGYVRRLIDDAAERDGEDIVQDVALNLFSRADVTVPIEHSVRVRVSGHPQPGGGLLSAVERTRYRSTRLFNGDD